jgi:hypothetical protein
MMCSLVGLCQCASGAAVHHGKSYFQIYSGADKSLARPGRKQATVTEDFEFHIKGKGKAVSTVTGLEWPRGFQEVKVPRFHDNGTGWW